MRSKVFEIAMFKLQTSRNSSEQNETTRAKNKKFANISDEVGSN